MKKIKQNENKKKDKYGVELDSGKMLDRCPAASANEYTGIVPVAIENDEEEKSYENMLCTRVGNYKKKKSR